MKQKNLFLESEGDGWYRRNKIADEKLAQKMQDDPVLHVLRSLNEKPQRVLEIGASNGWRLHALQGMFPGLHCAGIDPSAQAVAAAFPGIDMRQGTADRLPFDDQDFDLLIFGFCLYLCDRNDLFRIAAEADRVLEESGHMVVYDFLPPTAYKNAYIHASGVFSYKMDHSRMFSWNPAYRLIDEHVMAHPGTAEDSPDNRIGVTCLRKDMAAGWPDNPYKTEA